jgi:1-acyl-sn-glycerol-3-phosphate acyltransferase
VEIWSRPGQNVLAHLWGGIKVHREDYDRELFETVDAVLQTGHPLLIAPEGGRSHVPGLRTAKPGIAFLVERAHVPVVPVAVIGTTDDFWKKASQGKRPLLEMHIGKPVNLPALQGSGETRRRLRQENADLVMRLIAGMLPEEYRGVYADSAILP